MYSRMASKQVLLCLLQALVLWKTTDGQCVYGDVRLVDGPSAREGRVEICINDIWGTVCDDQWGTVDARVTCNQLNYDPNGAIRYRNAAYGQGTGPIWLDNVQCSSTSFLRLIDCPQNAIGSHNCDHSEDAGVYCPPCYEGSVWLPVGTNAREGTVEICHNGVWGTICDDQFGVQEAQVLCGQLGYEKSGAEAFSNAFFGERYGPIQLDNLACTGSESSILDCPGNAIGVHNCDHSEDAGIRCPLCEPGSIRLWSAYNTTPANEGMLHYCDSSGSWEAMCRYQWGCNDAKVACRNLGFNGSLEVNALVNVEGAYGYYKPILQKRLYCDGSEAAIKDCSFLPASWCDNVVFETAGVRCSPVESNECTNGDIKLVNNIDGDPDAGRVEYCFHGDWSSFCAMDDEEATVACKQLGYTDYSWASLFVDERYGSDGGVSDFDSIECSKNATEDHMINCTVNFSSGCTISSCPTEYGIKCFRPGSCTDGDLRLYNGLIEQEGTIEMCYNGVWGYMCSDNMVETDAYVICRQLGYDGGVAPEVMPTNFFGDRGYPMVWSNVNCGGWEKSILDCTRSEYLSFNCSRNSITGVRCYDDCSDNDVRLVGGVTDYQGTVEVCLNDLWGLVSEAGWSDEDTTVVCRALGLENDNAVTYTGSYFGRPSKTVHYTNVFCTGTEDSLEECTKVAISITEGKTTYSNVSVVGVDCSPVAPTDPTCVNMNVTAPNPTLCTGGDIRLGNQTGDAGRLEFCYSGQWSPFCKIDETTAFVACKDLGYTDFSIAAIYDDGRFGSVSNYSLFDNITCEDSTLSSLSDCNLGQTSCLPLCDSIGISCFRSGDCTDGDVRLADGLVDHEGRLEYCYQGVWSSVCDQGWDATDGHVACQQLGLPELAPNVFHNSYFGDGPGPIVISNIQCIGHETSLTDCARDVYPSFSCPRDHVAGILCGTSCQDGDLRLVNGQSDNEGTVEVCYDGVWGNIGNSGWSEKDAGLVCSLLGYLPDNPIVRSGSYFGASASVILISNLVCTGEESNILGCSYVLHSVPEGKDLILQNSVAGVTCAVIDTCDEPPTQGIDCAPEGDLQLVFIGSDMMEQGNEGTLMYCTQGYWSPFCTIDPQIAALACSGLGYADFTKAAIIDDKRYSPSTNVSYFQNFTCSEVATSLSDCILNRQCNKVCSIPYGVRCYEQGSCVENSVRLAGGYLPNEGRVEVCRNNTWGGVCADSWSQIDALVVCNQLGLGTAEPIIYTDSSAYGEVYGPYYYSNVQCQGWEARVQDCPKNDYYSTMCSRSNPASQICRDDCIDGSVKLVGGDQDYEGTVVVCRDNYWGLIGQTTWDINDAMVVCTQLGYPNDGTIARVDSYYGKPNLTLISSSVNCEGTESSLSECDITYLPFSEGKVASAHVSVAGVYCLPTPTVTPPCQEAPRAPDVCFTGDVRLSDSIDGESGRVEYCHNGQWSAFCSIDAATASVACYQLGFTRYTWASLLDDGVFSSPMSFSLFGSIKCTGEERELKTCAITDAECLPTCDSNAAIRCYNPGTCREGDRRLAGSNFDQRGRVELCINGLWGTVCDSEWDDTDALSFCADLGFSGTGAVSNRGSVYGAGTGPAIYSNVYCGGWETNFDNCLKSKYPAVSCTDSNLAGAVCAFDCNDGDIRLVDGNRVVQQSTGTVEICYNKLWGMVDDDGWGNAEASVVCNQLGLNVTSVTALRNSDRPNDPVHRTGYACSGNEARLIDCSSTSINIDVSQSYQNVAGVSCKIVITAAPVTNTSTTSPTSNSITGNTNNNSTLTVVVVILALLTLLGFVASAVIVGLVCYYQRSGSVPRKRMERSHNINRRHSDMDPDYGQAREVVNPLSIEPGLDGDEDENTKNLKDLIEESQLK